jgi:hypothetical protein
MRGAALLLCGHRRLSLIFLFKLRRHHTRQEHRIIR